MFIDFIHILLSNSKNRDALNHFLTVKGIMSKVFFYPCHLTNFYKKMKFHEKNKLGVTENVSDRILSLPMYPGLKKEELDYIVNSVSEFVESFQ